MFSVPLSRIPKLGSLKEEVVLRPDELGLSRLFRDAPVTVCFEASAMGKKALAKGTARAEAFLECGRCLKGVAQKVEAAFVVEFEPESGPSSPASRSEAVELEGLSVVLFQGERLPLGEEIRQEIELAVPPIVLCRPGCKGLCQECGADLNEGACGCRPGADGAPFSVLKDFFADLKEKNNG